MCLWLDCPAPLTAEVNHSEYLGICTVDISGVQRGSFSLCTVMVVTFSRSLWYGCLPMGPEGLENQLVREKNPTFCFGYQAEFCTIQAVC